MTLFEIGVVLLFFANKAFWIERRTELRFATTDAMLQRGKAEGAWQEGFNKE